MNIYLIRHGEKEVTTDDLTMKLTPKGIEQSKLLGQRLVSENIDIIYSSDMMRALMTAEEVNKYLNLRIEVRSGLREINTGECIRLGWHEAFDAYPEFAAEFRRKESDPRYPGGENGQDAWERAKDVLEEIKNTGYENVAVILHGGLIRTLICGAFGISQENRFKFARNEHCSISILQTKDNRIILQCYNDYTHLGDLR